VVGYGLLVGRSPKLEAFGHARTAADGARPFTTTTKIPMASVSKAITALAAVRVLAKRGISLDAHIGKFLPDGWQVDESMASITFRQLLSQTSGIKDYGNDEQDFARMKKLFTRKVPDKVKTTCTGSDKVNPQPFDPHDKGYCYSNNNFSIFRILLPKVEGLASDDPERLANRYVQIVQDNVFEPVGAKHVACKPPEGSENYAFSYAFPGKASGHDWGDDTLGCGAAGWYLSIDDIAKVLHSLNSKDGKILTEAQFQMMETQALGFDMRTTASGYRYLEKNGGWTAGNTKISTTIAFIGPGVIGALFMNSNIGREPDVGADAVLRAAYQKAVHAPVSAQLAPSR
jgi:CubicO group peptidase (beta-lactamase class C family)